MEIKRRKGLTLIECLISMILLAILLIAGMALYFYAQAGFRWSVHKRIAIEVANSEMESIKNMVYGTLPPPPSLGPGGLWIERSGTTNGIISIGNLSGCYKDVFVDPDPDNDINTNYKQVGVVVYWQEPGKSGSSSVSLDTYIAS